MSPRRRLTGRGGVLRQRARDLARERVLDFIGAPGAQIQTAARLWGHCAICGRGLTDPLSLERGVGPECIERVTDAIRFLAREGSSRENISLITGMLMDFIEEVLKEAQRNRKSFPLGLS